jgi:hypothetical protein
VFWKPDTNLPDYAASSPPKAEAVCSSGNPTTNYLIMRRQAPSLPRKITLNIPPKPLYICTIPYTVSDAEDGGIILPEKTPIRLPEYNLS